jgi:hypothetical protein
MKHGTLYIPPEGGARYVIEAKPHVCIKLKRVFPRLGTLARETYSLADTPEVSRDLEWFDMRFPLEMTPETRAHLTARAAEHKEKTTIVEALLAGREKLPPLELALPARDYQKAPAAVVLANGGLLVADEMGLGKLHAVDTLVLTPLGWRQIGTLSVGDLITGSNGDVTRVLGVYPQGVKPNYRVRFSDGSSVEAGDEHLWTVAYRCGGRRWQEITVTTEQLRTGATVETKWPNGVTGRMNLGRTALYLPMLSAPAKFIAGKALPLPAYLVGQLLANGGLTGTSARLTTNTADWDEIASRLHEDGVEIGGVHVYGNATQATISGAIGPVRDLGMDVLSGDKRIPPMYMQSSIDDRIALLQGLMDGDGSCSTSRNKLTYHSTSLGLAEDVREIVECLGGIASVREYDRSHENKPTDYQVRIRLPLSIRPFSTTRKASRYQPGPHAAPCRTFVSAEYVRDVESVCIRVEADDHLYVTEHAILTHNTVEAICMFCDDRTLPALVVTMTSLPEQWRAEVQKFAPGLRVAVIQSTTPYDLTKGCARGHHKFTEKAPGNPPRCRRCGAHPRETFKGHPPLPTPDVIITSYSKIHGWAETLAGVVQSVVWDEAQELRHAKDSNGPTRKYSAAELLANAVKFIMSLTGTPVYNWGSEMFNVMNVTRPGALGTLEEFNEEWTISAPTEGRSIKDPKAFGTYLREEGLMLRRTREDVGRELPPLTNVLHEVEADVDAFDEIGDRCAELARFLMGLDKAPPRGAEGPPEMGPVEPAKKVRGAQMAAAEELNWKLRQATGLAKAPYVAEFVRLLADQVGKVLLFGWHRAVYDLWMNLLSGHDGLPDLRPVMHTGSESAAAKQKARADFVDGESQVLLMSLRSAAGVEGLQTVCSDVVYGELDWSPGVHEQDSMRLHREGSKRPVFAYYLWADEGSDPIVMDVLGLKGAQAHAIRDPDLDLVEQLSGGGHHVKKLAEAYLAQREKRERRRIEKGMAAE